MESDTIKKLISAYVDGEANAEDAARAVEAIKSKSEFKTYYRELLMLKKTIKRLDNPRAYRMFKRAWRHQIGITKKVHTQIQPVWRYASLAAASIVILVVGVYVFLEMPSMTGTASDSMTFSATVESDMVMAENAVEADDSDMGVMKKGESEEAVPQSALGDGAEAREYVAEVVLNKEVYDAFISEFDDLIDEYIVEENNDGKMIFIPAQKNNTQITELLFKYEAITESSNISNIDLKIYFK